MSVRKQVDEVLSKMAVLRGDMKSLEGDLLRLQYICDHPNVKNYPSRPGGAGNQCPDCGKWF